MRKNIYKLLVSITLLILVLGSTGCGEREGRQPFKEHTSHSMTRIKTPKWTPPTGAHVDGNGYVIDEDGAVIGVDPSIPYVETPYGAAG